MSAPSEGSYDCQLCQKSYDNEVALTLHFCKHLSYKKYPCSTCRERFYSEDDRGEHCQKENHDNKFMVTSSSYCEMLVNMLLKDAKLLKVYNAEDIVAKRAKMNFEFEQELRDCEPKTKKELYRTSRKSSPPAPSSPMSTKISTVPSKQRKKSSPSKSREESNAKKNLKRAYTEVTPEDAQTTSEETKGKQKSSQIVLIGSKKRRKNSKECQLCQKMFATYGERKKHAVETHLHEKLSCPIENCHFGAFYLRTLNRHVKKDHNLSEDWQLSLEDEKRKAFEVKRFRQTKLLTQIFRVCFRPSSTPRADTIVVDNDEEFDSPLVFSSEDHQNILSVSAPTTTGGGAPEGKQPKPEIARDVEPDSPLVFPFEEVKNILPGLKLKTAAGDAPVEEQQMAETASPVQDDDIIFVKEKIRKKVKNSGVVVKREENMCQVVLSADNCIPLGGQSNPEKQISHPLQRQRVISRGGNQYSYGYRLLGNSCGSDWDRLPDNQDDSQGDNRHDPSG